MPNENLLRRGVRFGFVILVVLFCAMTAAISNAATDAPRARWTEQAAQDWYAKQPWLVGSNYIPANAINELEMWQADTFDPQRIDLELGWAESLGMNTMRVFLHDLLWKQDPEGFRNRIDTFLTIAQKHGIRPMLVLFDSCWDPDPVLGTQHAPIPGLHNSGWVQSPGAAALKDRSQYPRLEAYVKGVVGAFATDDRILAWDVWNEPDAPNTDYKAHEVPHKSKIIAKILPQAFEWAREAGATQPLTSGLWDGNWSSTEKMGTISKIQLENSDVVTFHNYDAPTEFEKRIKWLLQYKRPVICSEYMARSNGSFFEGSLTVAKKYSVGAINWGLVAGKTQTYFPWDSWRQPYTDHDPAIWFHEVFRTDGTPYIPEETEFIKRIIGRK